MVLSTWFPWQWPDQHCGTWIQTHTSPSPTLSGVSGTLWSIYFLALPGDFQVVKLAWQESVSSKRLLHTAFGPVLSRLGIFASTAKVKKIPFEFSSWGDKKWSLPYHTGRWSLSESGTSAENRRQYAQIFVFLLHAHNVPLKLEMSIWFANNEFVRKFSPGTKMAF